MKKNWVTLIELVVYLFIVSFIWFFVVIISRQFFDSIDNSNQIKNFSISYNDLLKNIYSNWYNWWTFSWNQSDWILLYNSGYYMWYKCYSTWVSITNISTWYVFDNNHYSIYTWFWCNSLSWWKFWSWYWVWLDLSVVWRRMWMKYFIF